MIDIIYLIIQNKNCIFNVCSENKTFFIAFDNYNSYIYDNTDTLITILNTYNLYDIYKYIYNNYNFNYLYKITDFNFEKYIIPKIHRKVQNPWLLKNETIPKIIDG